MGYAFDDALHDCLCKCFEVLAENLLIAELAGPAFTEEESRERFQRCCEACRKAREIAREQEKP